MPFHYVQRVFLTFKFGFLLKCVSDKSTCYCCCWAGMAQGQQGGRKWIQYGLGGKWEGQFWRISAMSWEMATARLVISRREQILWVTARVQEGRALLDYQIVAILCLKKKGRGNISGEEKKPKNSLTKKQMIFLGVKGAITLMLLTFTSWAMHEDREGLEQVHSNIEDIEEIWKVNSYLVLWFYFFVGLVFFLFCGFFYWKNLLINYTDFFFLLIKCIHIKGIYVLLIRKWLTADFSVS